MTFQHHGYEHNAALLDVELFRLASLFGSGDFIKEFAEEPEHGTTNTGYIHMTFSDLQRTEASRILISIAVITRNLIETSGSPDVSLENKVVGRYFKVGRQNGEPKPVSIDLSLGRALHKIIHATHIRIENKDQRHRYSGKIEPVVYLYEYPFEGWEAELHIKEFIEAIFWLY